jgi:hypothetical protein
MQPNMNADLRTVQDEQPFSAEAIQPLLASQSEQSAKPSASPTVSQQPLLKQPYGFGETCDPDIADMIDAVIFGNFS